MRYLSLLCLLICVSCATGFPMKELKEGMTMEAVKAEFGEPDAEETDCLTYWNERQDWLYTLIPLSPIFFVPVVMWDHGLTYAEAINELYIITEPVVIDFEEGKLTRWELKKRVVEGYHHTPGHMTYSYNPHNPAPGGVPGAPSWHTTGGGSSVSYVKWPKIPTCTKVRYIRPDEEEDIEGTVQNAPPTPPVTEGESAPPDGEQYIPDLEWCQKSCDNDHSGWCGLCDEEYPDWRADL